MAIPSSLQPRVAKPRIRIPRASNLQVLKYRLTVTDTATGKIVKRTRWRKSQSWVVNFQKSMWCYSGNVSVASTVDNVASSKTILPGPSQGNSSHGFNMMGSINNATFGIQIGTGTNAVTQADTALQTLIAHGGGANQMSYSAARGTGNAPVITTTFAWTWGRDFANTSGGTITVQEVGCSFQHALDSSGTTANFLAIRDLTGGVAVANGQSLAVDYTWTQGL